MEMNQRKSGSKWAQNLIKNPPTQVSATISSNSKRKPLNRNLNDESPSPPQLLQPPASPKPYHGTKGVEEIIPFKRSQKNRDSRENSLALFPLSSPLHVSFRSLNISEEQTIKFAESKQPDSKNSEEEILEGEEDEEDELKSVTPLNYREQDKLMEQSKEIKKKHKLGQSSTSSGDNKLLNQYFAEKNRLLAELSALREQEKNILKQLYINGKMIDSMIS